MSLACVNPILIIMNKIDPLSPSGRIDKAASKQVSKTMHTSYPVLRFSMPSNLLESDSIIHKNGDRAAILVQVSIDYRPR